MKKFAIIVDAYSTGSRLPQEFGKYGIHCIHVQSSENITSEFIASFRQEDFDHRFVVSAVADLHTVFRAIQAVGGAIAVVAGTETGVQIAESLAALLGLEGNNPANSAWRRDKYQMHERLRERGLSSLRQERCGSHEAAIEWTIRHGSWPVVVKPAASAGADSVTFCSNRTELLRAVDAILGKRNKLGQINEFAVLQERIEGQQFIVNAVSMGGRHYISEVWQDNKLHIPGASLVCDREILLPPDTALSRQLQGYVIRCLHELGVAEGPSHTELFKTRAGDLILIETAARMQGSIDHERVVEATGHSHVTLTAMRYADPQAFSRLLGKSYSRRLLLNCVTLCARDSGRLQENRSHQYLSQLTSFRSLIHAPRAGDVVDRTVDLFTNAGIVYLASTQEDVLEKEYRAIRDWERAGDLLLFSPQV